MTAPLTLAFTARASHETHSALAWWRENRPGAPALLERELRHVLALVATTPWLGSIARDGRIKGVRRVVLRRMLYVGSYRVGVPARRLDVLALWHTSRQDPTL